MIRNADLFIDQHGDRSDAPNLCFQKNPQEMMIILGDDQSYEKNEKDYVHSSGPFSRLCAEYGVKGE